MHLKLKHYLACERGNAAIEFAFVLPVLLLFIFGMIEFGFVIFETATLQGALASAAREGKTGYPDITDPGNKCFGGTCDKDSSGNIINYGPRWQKVKSILEGSTQSLFDSSKLTLSATAYPDFITLEKAMAGDPSVIGNSDDVGRSGQVVVYTATYPAPLILQHILGLGPSGNLIAHNIVRNEGF